MKYALLLTITVSILACGGSGSGGENFSTRVDSNVRLSEIDQEQSKQLCEDTQESIENFLTRSDLFEKVCMVAVVRDSDSIESCEERMKGDEVDECVKQLEELTSGGELDNPEDCDDGEELPFGDSCEATVGQFAACFDQIFGLAEGALSGISCESLNDPESLDELNKQVDLESTPEDGACGELLESCPDAL